MQIHRDVIANRFRKARGGDADNPWIVLADDVLQADPEVVGSAKYGSAFAKVGRRDIHRLAKMPDQVAADVRRATLRTVQKGNGPLDSSEHKTGAQRRADVAGVSSAGKVGGRSRRVDHRATSSGTCVVPQEIVSGQPPQSLCDGRLVTGC